MLTPTLRDGLERYAIGARLRGLRLKKKIGLVELAKHTGLSPALLSKIERGRLFPTLPTLLRIALVFSVDLAYFFAGARERPVLAVVRRRDRIRFPEQPGRHSGTYHFESLDFPATERKLNAYYAEFTPADPARLRRHEHAGVEFIYVVDGTLGVHVGESAHELEPGDAMYFDATVPHGYRRAAGRKCRAIVVTANS